MGGSAKPRAHLGSVAIGSVVLCGSIIGSLYAIVAMSSTVAGTASLPNGTTAVINGPFSCSESGGTTEIEAGGHTFAFTPTAISVDGVPVGLRGSSFTDVQIDSNLWSASLRVNGNEVPMPR